MYRVVNQKMEKWWVAFNKKTRSTKNNNSTNNLKTLTRGRTDHFSNIFLLVIVNFDL